MEERVFVEHTLIHINISLFFQQSRSAKTNLVLLLRQIHSIFENPIIPIHRIFRRYVIYIVIDNTVLSDTIVIGITGIPIFIKLNVFLPINLFKSGASDTVVKPLAIGEGIGKKEESSRTAVLKENRVNERGTARNLNIFSHGISRPINSLRRIVVKQQGQRGL